LNTTAVSQDKNSAYAHQQANHPQRAPGQPVRASSTLVQLIQSTVDS